MSMKARISALERAGGDPGAERVVLFITRRGEEQEATLARYGLPPDYDVRGTIWLPEVDRIPDP